MFSHRAEANWVTSWCEPHLVLRDYLKTGMCLALAVEDSQTWNLDLNTQSHIQIMPGTLLGAPPALLFLYL